MMKRMMIRLLALATLSVGAVAHAQPSTKFTLAGGEEPETKTWNEAASVAFVSNNGKKDSWAVNLAAKVEGQPISTSTTVLFMRALIEKNTQAKKEVENFGLSAGSKFDWNNANDGPGAEGPDTTAIFVFGESSLGLADKAIFADPKAACGSVYRPPECEKQRETSLRGQLALRFFMSGWENTFFYPDATHASLDGPSWTHSFSPVVTVFHDEILDAKVSAAGVKPDGGVTGVKVALGGAVSPKFTDYRLVLSAKIQFTEAFDRSTLRRAGFQKSAKFAKIGVDYELGNRSFEADSSGWVPAVGITYTKGDDPLSGKTDLDNVTVSFKATYRGKSK